MTKPNTQITLSRAQESSAAVERLYITMRHLFNRGFYKPMGVSGETLREALLLLRPEIYGSIAEEKVELSGLLYVIERLPIGIEECRYIHLTSDEGYRNSHFQPIVPPKRRRNCYRIDKEQMNIEITRGRSDIYDVLTHLTFIFIESHKIKDKILDEDEDSTNRDWAKIKELVGRKKTLNTVEREKAMAHLSGILGRSFEEINMVYPAFATADNPDRFIHFIYWLGQLALDEVLLEQKRTITFSPILRERVGHHIYGDAWAADIKAELQKNNIIHRPIHIISANMHSVMNSIFAHKTLKKYTLDPKKTDVFEALSLPQNSALRAKVKDQAVKEGMVFIDDTTGTNIDVQIFDTAKIDFANTLFKDCKLPKNDDQKPVIIVMDYAFGEQAYETIDELLKPFKKDIYLNVESISIMGKAGILSGDKGDIMIPFAHINEGTGDNYPFDNELSAEMFTDYGIPVAEGTMVTVLGTSLQNRDLLAFFRDSTWGAVGLEMEGAHYQKAIQSASKIRKSIHPDVKVRYAYYASDNPLKTGSTLASGGLGTTGVKPTYAITIEILKQLLK